MAEVVWTASAERDLHEIEAFIAKDSRRYAALTVRRIRAAVERLGPMPESGRRVPELPGMQYREVIVRPYRIVYRYRSPDDRVLIMAVVHGSRQLPVIEDGS